LSSAQIVLWSSVFVLVLAGVPLALWAFQRRRRPGDSDHGGGTPPISGSGAP